MKTLTLLPLLALLPLAAPQEAHESKPNDPQASQDARAPIERVEEPEAAPGGQESAPGATRERRLAPRVQARLGHGAGGGFLGVRLASSGAETTIAEVLPNTPAAEAGLQPGDRLVTVAGRPVTGADGVVADLARLSPGERVQLEVLRDGRLVELEAVLGERPADAVQGDPRGGGLTPRVLEPDGRFRIFGFGPQGGFWAPDASRFGVGDGDLRQWLEAQEQRADELREQLERQFFDLRREFDRDFGDLRRDLERSLERNLGRGGAWLERRFGNGPLGGFDIPAEAWADLEARLAPLEEQRLKIAREWAEAHGHPEWADAVPPFGVEVKIERREEKLSR